MSGRRIGRWVLAASVVVIGALAAVVVALNLRGEGELSAEIASAQPGLPASAELVARGAYLARAGNCMACHTARGGEPYAGGRGIDTPFGTVYSSNLKIGRASCRERVLVAV